MAQSQVCRRPAPLPCSAFIGETSGDGDILGDLRAQRPHVLEAGETSLSLLRDVLSLVSDRHSAYLLESVWHPVSILGK